ncbi:glucose dehydrogenase [FAD, quinone]-like [Pararge aegeria]|uniref:glucose dehydrogenase [FAD, quinone]-like n=1 Tax=Pararge aegeria TaxID=116150 RepID=UPI0019D185CA|nr:glucose dehydrogenase [FAD, quinone]-like [Pararge aegeria]
MSGDTCVTSAGGATQLFASALNFLAATQCILPDSACSYNDEVANWETFDFIVVGGGSAGSVVANRLSEVCDWKVLLLEAGPEPPLEADIPRLYRTLSKTKYDWHYITKSNEDKQQALKNSAVPWLRGKMLGGTSSINAMLYVRGSDYDFQSWFDEGNPSWSPENVNYYFKKAENLQDIKLSTDDIIYDTYGHEGPLVVNSYNTTNEEVIQNVLDSYDYIGIKKVPDINAVRFQGHGVCGKSRVTARNGVRESTYRAYLKKAQNRSNLKIITNAFVTKILVNEEAKAYGVEVDINGKRKNVLVKLEVILSGGAINTPQILMLSGIGPKDHLLSKNIPCIVDLPGVGKNLQDHLSIPIPIYVDESEAEDIADQMFDVAKYLYNKTGYLAHVFLSDAIAFFSRSKEMKYPEFQSHFAIYRKNTTVRQFIDVYTDDVLNSLIRHISHKSLFSHNFNVLHPHSRGKIYLNTSNPYDYPIIDANYLGDERDIEDSVDGIKILTKIIDSPYYKSINAFIPRIEIPQCNQYEFLSDLYWRCYVIHMTSTMSHPVGTAKMGPSSADSVVDNFLKVHGVRGLRVIDASVMPFETSGNTNAPTIMIGEMGSDMIKDEYLGKSLSEDDIYN